MNLEQKIYRKKENLVARKIGEEYILVPIINSIAEMDRLYTLNEVGSFIWEQIDGQNSINDIIYSVTSQFEVNEMIAREDVIDFLKKTENVLTV